MLTRTYKDLQNFYQDNWAPLSSKYTCIMRSDFDRILRLLKIYTEEWGTTHGKVVKDIIAPWFTAEGKRNQHPPITPCSLLYQISLTIPKKNIRPNGGLAAIFEVIHSETRIDINIFYEPDNIRKLQLAMRCHDSVTMKHLLENNKVDITSEYRFDDTKSDMTPLQYMLNHAVMNKKGIETFTLGIQLFINHDRNCINQELVSYFEELKKEQIRKNVNSRVIRRYGCIIEYLKTEYCTNQIIQFICSFSLLQYLPTELIAEICVLMIQTTLQHEQNYTAKRLLREYMASHKDTEIDLVEKIQHATQYYETNYSSPARNPGLFLLNLSTYVTPNEIPGFHDTLPKNFRNTLHKIGVFSSIDISAFYQGSELQQFFSTHRVFIEALRNINSLIELVLKYPAEFKNPVEDITLLFAHPYCSANGKRGMIRSFIAHYKQHEDSQQLLEACAGLLVTTPDDLLYSLKLAITSKDSYLSSMLFCLATNATDLNAIKEFYEKNRHHAIRSLQILNRMVVNISQPIDSTLLLKLFEYLKPCANDYYYISLVFSSILQKKGFISNPERVIEKFIEIFIVDINRIIQIALLHTATLPTATYLLAQKIPGARIIEESWYYDIRYDRIFLFKAREMKNKNAVNKMSMLQCILFAGTGKRFPAIFIAELAHAIISYDKRCLDQVDDRNHSAVHYLHQFISNLDMRNIHESQQNLFDQILSGILHECAGILDTYKTQKLLEFSNILLKKNLPLCLHELNTVRVSKMNGTFFNPGDRREGEERKIISRKSGVGK